MPTSQHSASSTAASSDAASSLVRSIANPELPIPAPLKQEAAAIMKPKEGDGRSTTTAQWNTENLGRRFGADILSAALAAALVAPIIGMIDKSIIVNAAGKNSIPESLRASIKKLILRPDKFIFQKPFALIYMLYAGTYISANCTDTISSTMKDKPANTVSSGGAKFITTSSVNMGLCLYKDAQFAKIFGVATSAPRPIPGPSYMLFAIRDSMTVFAAFNLPPLIAPYVPLSQEMERKFFSRANAAQFAGPALMQFLSTPLHLMGLDLYNRPNVRATPVSFRDRLAIVKMNYFGSTIARMGRIIPAYGIGGVINRDLRQRFMVGL